VSPVRGKTSCQKQSARLRGPASPRVVIESICKDCLRDRERHSQVNLPPGVEFQSVWNPKFRATLPVVPPTASSAGSSCMTNRAFQRRPVLGQVGKDVQLVLSRKVRQLESRRWYWSGRAPGSATRLIDRQYHGVLGQIELEVDDILDLVGKLRIHSQVRVSPHLTRFMPGIVCSATPTGPTSSPAAPPRSQPSAGRATLAFSNIALFLGTPAGRLEMPDDMIARLRKMARKLKVTQHGLTPRNRARLRRPYRGRGTSGDCRSGSSVRSGRAAGQGITMRK
jgi:hypothetical protein